MAEKLTEAQLSEALAQLPAWSGDTGRIRRTAHPGPRRAELLEQVRRVADELNHHPVVDEQDPLQLRFDVWTHSEGGVTELDVALARRIDTVIADLLAQ
jgi:4a-hydroxytetrahydrobiopterin dehydratase